jgi:DNA-binding NtrC family response regulator
MTQTTTAAVAIEAQDVRPLATVRVLVVDGDPAQLRSIQRWLDSQSRVRAYGFVSAEEALTHGTGGEYDVCLIDERLDGWSGVMLGAMIGALNPAARLILMTASRNPRVERQAREHGFHAVVGKPVQLRLLNETILAAVDDHDG